MAADIVRSSRKPFSFIDEELMKKIESQRKPKNDSGEGRPIRGKEHFYGHNQYHPYWFQQPAHHRKIFGN